MQEYDIQYDIVRAIFMKHTIRPDFLL